MYKDIAELRPDGFWAFSSVHIYYLILFFINNKFYIINKLY